VWAILGSNQ